MCFHRRISKLGIFVFFTFRLVVRRERREGERDRRKEGDISINIYIISQISREMTEVIPVAEEGAVELLSFWGWFVMVWTDIIFNFQFEKDWPTVAVFFATLCIGLVVFYEIGKSLGKDMDFQFYFLTFLFP